VTKEYLETTSLIERMHRRFLDVIRTELNRIGIRDINSVQAMLLANIGQEEIVIRDLIERGYYQGSNVSYNIKKLSELGYLEQERTAHDKRSVTIHLTEKAMAVVRAIRELEDRLASDLAKQDMDAKALDELCASLRRLERTWADYIHYGGR
jgi:DNA-binding MarR family transcriptional regulator